MHRSLLLDPLGHFQRITALAHGVRCALAPSAVTQILAIAARDQRISLVTQALLRVHAKLDTKQLDGLVAVEGRHHGALVCRKLWDAGGAFAKGKGPASFQVLAVALSTCRGWCWIFPSPLRVGIKVKAWSCRHCSRGQLAIALFDVNKALRHIDLAPRIVAFHKAACAGAPGATCLQQLAMPGYAVACSRMTCTVLNRLRSMVVLGNLSRATAKVGKPTIG